MLASGDAQVAMALGDLNSGARATRMPLFAKLSETTAASASQLQALTRAIRDGDPEAFAQFYDAYHFRIYRYLLVLARGDEDQARDVCQAVLIKLARRFPVFEEEPALWAWLRTLARNSFIDHCRADHRRRRWVSLEELGAEPGTAAETEARLAELLRDELAALSLEERELVQAVYVDDQPIQSLADESGQTYKAVECRLARLRRRLKEQLLKRLHHDRET